jgi:hypothetical protein
MRLILAGILIVASSIVSAADAVLVLRIMQCESGLRHDAIGDGGRSRGIAQFRKETFYEFAKLAKLRDKGLGEPDWMNPQQQAYLLNWGLDNGYGRRWACYRKLKGARK